ncbi:MAG: NifU family protein [Candidatus Margulisiibacteriota bacterium]
MLNISAQITPNPNALKFVVDKQIIPQKALDFPFADSAKGSPLVEQLWAIDGVCGVMVGPYFVTVNKTNDTDWAKLVEPVTDVIKTVLDSDIAPISQEKLDSLNSGPSEDDEIVQKIKAILDNEIRPAIAMDGGDVSFESYDDGVVALQLQGACSSCPSSVLTLKMGIENRLREEIPEIKEIIQV